MLLLIDRALSQHYIVLTVFYCSIAKSAAITSELHSIIVARHSHVHIHSTTALCMPKTCIIETKKNL